MKVLDVLETMGGLELQLQERGRIVTATIPQEVQPKPNYFKAKRAGEDAVQISYCRGNERRVYEAAIRR